MLASSTADTNGMSKQASAPRVPLHRPLTAGASAPSRGLAHRLGSTDASLLVALAAVALAAYVALSISTDADYSVHGPVSADNAAPALLTLAHGHLGAALARQPMMGALSLILRVPAVWLGDALGAGSMSVYRLGALICMLPLAALAAWVVIRACEARALVAGIGAAAILLLGSPIVAAIGWGHPEEVLTATLAVAAVLLAERGRPVAAGVAVGAAIGTKDWAVVALLPVAVALPRDRGRAAVPAAAVAFVLAGLPPLLDPHAFARASHALGSVRAVGPLSAWWPISVHHAPAAQAGQLAATLPLQLAKSAALVLALAVALGAAALLSWTSLRAGGRLTRRQLAADPLALLALLGLVRCLADPGPVEYYYVAALVPLAVWEARTLRRLPLASLVLVAVVRFSFSFGSGSGLSTGFESAITLLFGAAFLVHLSRHSFWTGRPRPADSIPTGGS